MKDLPERLRYVFPIWIRIREDAQKHLHEEYIKAARGEASKEFVWLSTNIVDYRESCVRCSLYQTWRTRLVRALLWMAEKLHEPKSTFKQSQP